jgi:hypothetical protein
MGRTYIFNKKQTAWLVLSGMFFSGCGYLFTGPKVSRRQFYIVDMPGFSDSVKTNAGIKFDRFYYRYIEDIQQKDTSGIKVSKYYYFFKFYPSGKLGFSNIVISRPLDSIKNSFNNWLEPSGYQWGYYFIQSDTIYMEVRTRNGPYQFWAGKIDGDKIHVTHDLDNTLIKRMRSDSFIIEYKY